MGFYKRRFLKHYCLSVDMKSHRFLDPLTRLKVQGIASSVMSSLVLSLLPKKPKTDYEKILMDFPNITNPYNGNIQIKDDVTHHIETRGPLVFAKPRRSAPERLKLPRKMGFSTSYSAQKDCRGLAFLWGLPRIKQSSKGIQSHIFRTS